MEAVFRMAKSDHEFMLGKRLFSAYAKGLGIDLGFQDFAKELEQIDLQYGEPDGALIIAYRNDNQPLGCFGIRKLEADICELKRMYLIPQARGLGLGTRMMKVAIEVATELSYEHMRLDTLSTMTSAIALYTKNGFYEIEAYRYNPIPTALYFERRLL